MRSGCKTVDKAIEVVDVISGSNFQTFFVRSVMVVRHLLFVPAVIQKPMKLVILSLFYVTLMGTSYLQPLSRCSRLLAHQELVVDLCNLKVNLG